MNTLTDSIAEFLNQLTDMDWGWWPFLFLRPERDEFMDTMLVAKMTLYFGSMFTLLYVVLFSIETPMTMSEIVNFAIFMYVVFFVGYRLTFAIAWNHRAMQLQQQ